jgi:MFS family permease
VTLVVASAATLLVLINYTAPMTMLSPIAASLHASVGGQIWVLSGISLGLAALLLTAGSLADDYGRKRVFLIGTAVMAVASLGCAVSTATLPFVLARIVQGCASASLTAASLGLIGDAYPVGAERIRATGVWGAMVGLGIAIGPILSAAVTEVLGWRAVFWVLAVAALAVFGAALKLAESRSAAPRRVDVMGVLTFGPGVTLLLAALIEGRQGWEQPLVLALTGGSVALLLLFVAVEARGREPMFDLGLLSSPVFVAASVGALFTGLAVIGLMSYVPTVLERSLHLTPLGAGAVLAIWSGTSFVVALQARRLAPYVNGRNQLALGMLLCGIGEAAMVGLTEHSSWVRLVPGLAVAGLGSGLLNAALARLAVESVPAGRGGMGSGANNTARYVGSSIGVAIVVAVVSSGHASGPPAHALAQGSSLAAAASAGLAGLGALLIAVARERSGPSPVPAAGGLRG